MSETKLYRVWWVYTCDDLSCVEVIPMTAEPADDVRKRFQKAKEWGYFGGREVSEEVVVGSYDDIVDVLLEAEAVHEDEIEAEARY